MKVLIPLADGVEEMEFVIIVDVLRRAGWEVVSAGLKAGVVKASRGVQLVPDVLWERIDISDFDGLVFPGGSGGTDILKRDVRVLEAIRSFDLAQKWVAAVCAGPLVLQAAGILEGRKVTCHPGVVDQLTVTDRIDQPVVVDGHLVTSQGPGTSFLFALTLVGIVENKQKAVMLAAEMVLPDLWRTA